MLEWIEARCAQGLSEIALVNGSPAATVSPSAKKAGCFDYVITRFHGRSGPAEGTTSTRSGARRSVKGSVRMWVEREQT